MGVHYLFLVTFLLLNCLSISYSSGPRTLRSSSSTSTSTRSTPPSTPPRQVPPPPTQSAQSLRSVPPPPSPLIKPLKYQLLYAVQLGHQLSYHDLPFSQPLDDQGPNEFFAQVIIHFQCTRTGTRSFQVKFNAKSLTLLEKETVFAKKRETDNYILPSNTLVSDIKLNGSKNMYTISLKQPLLTDATYMLRISVKGEHTPTSGVGFPVYTYLDGEKTRSVAITDFRNEVRRDQAASSVIPNLGDDYSTEIELQIIRHKNLISLANTPLKHSHRVSDSFQLDEFEPMTEMKLKDLVFMVGDPMPKHDLTIKGQQQNTAITAYGLHSDSFSAKRTLKGCLEKSVITAIPNKTPQVVMIHSEYYPQDAAVYPGITLMKYSYFNRNEETVKQELHTLCEILEYFEKNPVGELTLEYNPQAGYQSPYGPGVLQQLQTWDNSNNGYNPYNGYGDESFLYD